MIFTSTLSSGALPNLESELISFGLKVRHRPLVRFVERPIESIAATLRSSHFSAIVVTSPRSAKALSSAATLFIAEDRRFPPVWAAGPATAAELPLGMDVRVPAEGTGASPLAQSLLASGTTGPVLYLCSAERREEIPVQLRKAGLDVIEILAYDVELAGLPEVEEALEGTDVVLIASHRVIRLAGQLKRRPSLICLGPSTGRTASEIGWEPVAVAATPTTAGVIEAVQSLLFAAPGPQSSPSNPSSGL